MSATPIREGAPVRKQIGITVPEKVYAKLGDFAAKAGMSRTAYATMIFEAAYAARCGVSGDRELDQVVAATLILHGLAIDHAAVAKVLGISEDLVERIVGAALTEFGE